MNKYFSLILIFLMMLFIVSASAAQETAPDTFDINDPGTAEEITGEEEEDDPRIKLNISYQKEEEAEPFLIGRYRNWPGFFFNIASPVIEGYAPDTLRLTGFLEEDLDWTVLYHLQTYSLTVHYRLLDGRPAAPDYHSQETFGSEYLVRSPYVAGYKAVKNEVSGEMPGRDVELTVFYVSGNARFL